ncbi:MAG: hypothetical protein AAFV53_10810 [Myxococcota bacterium]
MSAHDEFYVGYQPNAPEGLGRFLRMLTASLLVVGVLVALAAVGFQQPFGAARFEFGETRTFEGTLLSLPQPMLIVARPGEIQGEASSISSYYLVNPGKIGAGDAIADLSGQHVTLEGTLIYRDNQTMIEILPDTVAAADGTPLQPSRIVDLGEHTFVGEIVDSKCFLGVMVPGNLKPHRACATRCISGGIPPILLVRREDGTARHLLLVGPSGEAINHQILDLIAEPVEITGKLERHLDRLVLKADPTRFQRLN